MSKDRSSSSKTAPLLLYCPPSRRKKRGTPRWQVLIHMCDFWTGNSLRATGDRYLGPCTAEGFRTRFELEVVNKGDRAVRFDVGLGGLEFDVLDQTFDPEVNPQTRKSHGFISQLPPPPRRSEIWPTESFDLNNSTTLVEIRPGSTTFGICCRGAFHGFAIESEKADAGVTIRLRAADDEGVDLIVPLKPLRCSNGVGWRMEARWVKHPLTLAPWADRWRVGEEVSSGAQGRVSSAWRLGDDRLGALKEMPDGKQMNSHARERMRREALALQKVRGVPGVPDLLDDNTEAYGDSSVPLFLVTEFCEGSTLHGHIRANGALALDVALGIVEDLTRTVKDCHARGVLHRDIKPANIMMVAGKPVLIDFGISWHDDGETLTYIDEGLGNNFLRLPELQLNSPADGKRNPRSDVTYLVGVLYYLITAREPGSLQDAKEDPPHVAGPLPTDAKDHPGWGELRALFDQGFRQSIEERLGSCESLLAYLSRVRVGAPVSKREGALREARARVEAAIRERSRRPETVLGALVNRALSRVEDLMVKAAESEGVYATGSYSMFGVVAGGKRPEAGVWEGSVTIRPRDALEPSAEIQLHVRAVGEQLRARAGVARRSRDEMDLEVVVEGLDVTAVEDALKTRAVDLVVEALEMLARDIQQGPPLELPRLESWRSPIDLSDGGGPGSWDPDPFRS